MATKNVIAAATAAAALTMLGGCASKASSASPAPAPDASATTSAVPASASQNTMAPASAVPSTPSTPSAPSSASSGGGSVADCTSADTRSTASAVTEPINHVLLTVTDTASAPCKLYLYPLLRFDAQQQAPTQYLSESKPQTTVITLAPGQSAYAGVTVSAADGSGADGRTVKSAGLSFAAASGSGSVGAEVQVALPSDTYVDDAARVTYWQSSSQDALTW